MTEQAGDHPDRERSRARPSTVEPRKLLVDVLREDLGLPGTHIGCEHGVCGTCTVLLDGASVRVVHHVRGAGRRRRRSAPSRALADGPSMHPLQEAFWDKQGLQCGYCTPGDADARLRDPRARTRTRRARRSRGRSRATCADAPATSSSSRPCSPRRRMRGERGTREPDGGDLTTVERPARRAPTRRPQVGRQVDPPRRGPQVPARPRRLHRRHVACRGMLHAARPAQPARRTRAIVVDRHERGDGAAPACSRSITGAQAAELTDPMPDFGPAPPSTSGAVWRSTRSATSARASSSIAAESRYVAEDALDLVEVEYEPLDAVVDPERGAAQDGAPLVHDALGSNLAYERTFDFGDVDGDFAAADVDRAGPAALAPLRRPAARDRRRDRGLRPRHRHD